MPRPPSAHAVVGCGRVAPNHVDAFRALDGWTVAWACDRDPATAAAFASEYGIPRVTGTIDDVLADPDVVSVSIVVDHAQHAGLVERALRAGKHVLVEKPLALSVEEGERLLRIAEECGRVLSVVSQHRYDPLVVGLSDWLSAGLLGRLLYVRSVLEASRDESYYKDSYWRGTWEGEGGSALINQGYHCLDVTRAVCGELTVVSAMARAGELFGTMRTEDTLCALLAAGPVPVSFAVTVGSTVTWRTRLEFVGTAGTVELDLDHPGKLHRAWGNPELERRAAALDPAAEEAPPGTDYYGISHRRQAADFTAAIASGKQMAADARSGLAMVRLITGLYDAAGLPRVPAAGGA
ncbi:Gfo/Idh/MocA family protein [Streptantibioticus silvisoli]|uniref:Gfo/Idh/MocA family oxidoreductase n=1 Tax=Streptantibioticus silvisoli TaxID=2705255 RepID=A0ABT6VSC0_9ACTN|nr:Gfo/Idh/MocA family oxidoreductase [Streptantibioticus silvisoli]MDI5961379.1 Gfo/Idh/MocA family oxidoreductase [Streptantibioticus silvisoli]